MCTKVLFFASSNKHKVEEIKKIFRKYNIQIESLLDINENLELNENGKTIEENSFIKAKLISEKLKIPVISDDSGLEILELNNFPGIHSKRWAFPVTDEIKINELLLEKCKNIKNRQAIFKTVITYYNIQNNIHKQFIGILKGEINNSMIIKNGFAYDYIFKLSNGKILSQISLSEKNKISHRAKAIKQFIDWWLKEGYKL